MTSSLYHVSGWDGIATAQPGDSFTLRPGGQGAEGGGVYFSEGAPRYSAAEGSHGRPSAVIVIDRPQSPTGWWRSKNAVCQKYGRPRTWHTAGESLALIVARRDDTGNVPFIFCVPRLGEKGLRHEKNTETGSGSL